MDSNIGRKDLDLQDNDNVELKKRLLGATTEVGTGIGTDLLTGGLLNPATVAGTKGLSILAYAGINGFQGAYTNYLVQKHLYGADNVNWGEILSSGALSAIPFMNLKAGKNVANIVGDANTVRRGIVGSAGLGLAGEQLRVGIDEQRVLSPLEAGMAIGIGGGIGGGLTQLSKLGKSPQLSKPRKAPKRIMTDQELRMRGELNYRLRKSIDPVAYISKSDALELGLEQPMASRFADDLDLNTMTSKQFENELNLRSVDLGYSLGDVSARTRTNQLGIPKDISSIYLNHAEAYNKAMRATGGNMEKFPTLIWNDTRFRPKAKPLKGNKNYVYFESWINRRTNKKLGKDRRSMRIWKQTSKDVAPGTFYREKLRQLRELNAQEDAQGLTRTRLRDVEMDHKNALRSVEIYTEGLSEGNTKYVFSLLEQYGLFTGDDSRNLALRNKQIHRKLWPKMKAALKKLNHKTIKDFQDTKNPELEYLLYLAYTTNPRTGVTPLREYVETIKFIEEEAAEAAKASWKQRLEALANSKLTKADKIRKELVEIFGGKEEGEENLKAFIKRLKEYPPEHRTDMIRGEFERIGGFGPLDEDDLRKILNE